jgi:ABC-type uncharacterized transport system permease subunit
METKQWYKSTTIQSVIAIVVIAVFQMLMNGAEPGQTIDTMTKTATDNKELITQILTLLASAAAIRGRLKADTKIAKKEKDNG